jgi:hypothetical protein
VAENVIELNGKRYDAVSGAYLGVSSAAPTATAPSVKHPKKGRAIDGFIRPTTTNTKHAHIAGPVTPVKPAHHAPKVSVSHPAHKPKPAVKPAVAAAPVKHSIPARTPAKPQADVTHAHAVKHTIAQAHKAAAAARAHHPEHAKTLARRYVHKPAFSMKPAIKTQAPAEVAAKPLSAITVKRSALQVDEARLERAKNVIRHSAIRRFMPIRPDYSPAAVEHTPRRAPAHVPHIAVHPVPATVEHRARSHSDIFEAAIARADSHKQPRHKLHHPHRRLINTLAVIGALVVIGGFITYLNIPNIQLHVASIQAGFKADIPSYKPTGYALNGGVKRTGNTVSMRFTSGENSFVITQQPSDWNSQTLVENTLALTGDKHQTVEVGGRTVYIYDGSNAVWVNGGVRYDINTSSPLSADDISKLASSL